MRAALAGILVAAAVARLWAIGFCLPGLLCRPDEEAVSGIATQFFARDLDPHFFDWPTLFMYETAAGITALFNVGRFLGWYRGEFHFLQTIAIDASPVILTARLLSATAGFLSVVILFRIALRLFDETTALIAALFLALAFLHVRDSHFGVTDVSATFMVLVALLFIVRFAASGTRTDLAGAAIATGLAASTKYNAALIGVAAMWVLLRHLPAARSGWMRGRLAGILMFAALATVAFAVTSPYCLIDHEQFIASLRGVGAHLAQGHGVNVGRGWTVHLTSSLRYGLGVPLLAAGIAGLVALPIARPRIGGAIATFPIVYYVIAGGGYTVFARYIIPIVPFLCLTAAFAVVEAARALASRARMEQWASAIAWTVAAVVVAPSAVSVVYFDRLLARTDTRSLAAAWVRDRFSDGAVVAQAGRRSMNLFFLPEAADRPSRYETVAVTEEAGDIGLPDALVIPATLFDPHAPVPRAATALAARYAPEYSVSGHSIAAEGVVYDWQDEFYLPLTGFSKIWRPGPNLTIYVRPAGRQGLVN